MVVRALAAIALTILVGGCDSAAPVYIYSKPGAALEQMMRDEALAESPGTGLAPARAPRALGLRGPGVATGRLSRAARGADSLSPPQACTFIPK